MTARPETGLVSVVVPTRNRRRLVGRALTTVLMQRDVALDVVVVVDGSHDGTADALRESGAPVTVVEHDCAFGVSAARNAGIARARGAWIAFLDDDDVWAPDKLAAQLAAARAAPDAGWVMAGATAVGDDLRLIGEQPAPDPRDLTRELLMFNVVPGGGSGVLARTDLVRDVGGFDPEFSNLADRDLWIRLALAAPATAVQRPLVGYVIHDHGMAHDVQRSVLEREAINRKYAAERAAYGHTESESPAWLAYLGGMYLRAGDRFRSAHVHARLARRHGERRAWLLVAAGLVSPNVQRWRDRRSATAIDPEWRAATACWLAPLQERERAGDPWRLDGTPEHATDVS
jgi:glycosyltransferase involved in cell wall biosynthesis